MGGQLSAGVKFGQESRKLEQISKYQVLIEFYHLETMQLYCILTLSFFRWLVKKARDKEALQVLTKIYRDKDKAQKQLSEIKATLSVTKQSLSQSLKYVCRWTILQR